MFFRFILLFLYIFSYNLHAKVIKFATFNAGLAHTFVPLAKERRLPIIKSIKKSDVDVLCLQEVWTKDDRFALQNSLKSKYPYSFFTKIKQTKTNKTPSCGISDLFGKDKFVSCLRDQCDSKKGDKFTACVIKNCRGQLDNLKNNKPDCARALLSQVGKSALMGIISVVNPFFAAGVFAYDGSDGVMLFSKYPLEEKKLLDLSKFSTGVRRVALFSSIKMNENKINITCAHLTANLETVSPYTGGFKNWEEENKIQLKAIFENYQSKKQVVMGDFNCGTTKLSQNLNGEFEKNCSLYKNYNFRDHFFDLGPKCTFCSTNSLLKSLKRKKSSLIDHIYTKGLNVLSSKRFMTEKIPLVIKGTKVESNLSDHFGIITVIETNN